MPRFGEIRERYRLGPRELRPGEKAPHQDVGRLISDFITDLQGIGEDISDTLDKPFERAGFQGPHRIVDNYLDEWSEMVRRRLPEPVLRGRYYFGTLHGKPGRRGR